MKAGRSPRRHGKPLLLGTLAIITLVVLASPFVSWEYESAELTSTDWLARAGRRMPPNPEIVVLAIDSASQTLDELMESDGDLARSPALQLMKLGWPWPREVYRPIIERLANAGAKVIAFDMMFPTARDGDDQFRAALDRFRDRVVVGGNLGDALQDARGGEKDPFVPPAPTLIDGDAAFDPRVGFVNFRPDIDGRVRRAQYRTTMLEWSGMEPRAGSPEIFSLSARMAQQFGRSVLIPTDHGTHMIRYGDETLPYSLHEIFVDRLWREKYGGGSAFKDKIVLIAPYGDWAKDVLETSMGTRRPGPQIHVAALNALLTGEFLQETSPLTNLILTLGGALASFQLAHWARNALARFLGMIALATLYLVSCWWLFNNFGVVPQILSPLLTLIVPTVVYLAIEGVSEYQERLRLRKTLEQYVSRDVVKEVLDNPQSYLNTLGGARKHVTVLFSDVRGFTSMTESADPEAFVAQLREYFTLMVRIVFAQLGTLDKFIGDAVMAHWGGITSRGEGPDACRAVAAGLEMLHVMPRLNAAWAKEGMPQFKIGLGINHGEAICGHVGSDEKHEFTAIGDAVNLASRLEGATKEFHVDLLIGGVTADLVRDTFTLRAVDLLRVKGKTRPVEVFTVLDLRNGAVRPAWLDGWEEGVRLYRSREFQQAEGRFAAISAELPEDWLAAEYLRRARAFCLEPPPADWDGVYTMTQK